MPLTDTFLRSLKTNQAVKKYADGGGLYLHVAPTGGKLWRMAYRYKGRQKLLSFGAYPALSLKDARAKRDEAKAMLASGIDPAAHKKAVKASVQAQTDNTFEIVAREWHDKFKGAWAASHADKLLARFDNDIFPHMGGEGIHTITAPALLEVIRKIEARGALETAHRALQTCGQVFRYAIATGRAERDPSTDLRGALPPVKATNFASITDPALIGALLRDIEAHAGNVIVRAALRMAPYVFVRPTELRRAEWTEFDLDKAEWRIPPARMKMKEMHIVPLAWQVLALLKELRPYTMQSPYLFPSMRAKTAPISDATLLAALRRMGYDKDTLTVHGFRSTASTLLNELGYNRDWIERQLAHGERNSVRAAYNYAQYLPERQRMMQEWADYLDGLKANPQGGGWYERIY